MRLNTKIFSISKKKKWFFFLFLTPLLIWGWISLSVPSPLFDKPTSALLYSGSGDLLGARIATDGQWRFPPQADVPDKFKTCLIQFEDKRFFYHPGIDPIAFIRATVLNIRGQKIVSGGSTLTMQLVRLSRDDKSRTFSEKWIEMWQALYLETIYSKNDLLSLYAANAPFGGNVVGLDAASWRYFGREASALSWAETATLAVLPNAPSLIYPGRNRPRLLNKRNKLLKRLCDNGVIDKTTLELSILEPLPGKPLPLPNDAPHLLERLAAGDPGNLIRTSILPGLQQQAQRIVNERAHSYRSNHIDNAAALIADVETGEVLAYVGNVTGSTAAIHADQVDIITSRRSTGSILKPLLYAAMLHDGQILPGTLVADIPLNINGFTPQNYARTFQGAVPAHVAIERSLNVPLVRMLNQYQVGRFLSLLKETGMTTLPYSEDHYGSTLILGGAEGTLWDLCGVYASLARVLNHYHKYNGRYLPGDIHPLSAFPVSVQEDSIVSPADKRLTDYPLYSAASLWFAFDAMSALNRPEEEADWQQFSSMKKIAWKTGTSYGNRDAWAIGVTPRYVIGVWVGNASGEGRSGLTGVGHAAPILFDLFSLLPSGGWFDTPYDELARFAICRKSGYKASPYCEQTDSVLLPLAAGKTAVCPFHRLVHLSPDGRYRVNSSCAPVGQMISRPWFVLPPAQEYYYRSYHVDYQPLPPVMPGCEDPQGQPFDLIYPEHGAILYLPRGFGGDTEKFVFKAAHSKSEAIIYWHLDKKYLGETRHIHQIACMPEPGRHVLTLVDEEGNQKKILFEVK